MRIVMISMVAAMTGTATALPRQLPVMSFGTGSSTSKRDDVASLTSLWLALEGSVGVDTAFVYHDEEQVGQGIRLSGRKDVFLTTKVMCEGLEGAAKQATANLAELAMSSVDLLLIHQPCESTTLLNETWTVLEAQVAGGRAAALGVSNFDVAQLKALAALAPRVPPTVNQIQMHVGCMPSPELVTLCAELGVLLEAYSPLGKGNVLGNADVLAVAEAHGRSAAQVALQYLVQKGFALTFTTSKERYMRENLAVVLDPSPLSRAEMARLDAVTIPCRGAAAELEAAV